MKNFFRLHLLAAVAIIATACYVESEPMDDSDFENIENPTLQTASLAESVEYVWNEEVLPEITIRVDESEWNNMLKTYDQNAGTKQYFRGDMIFKSGEDEFRFKEAGWRLKGNTSRRRPEGDAAGEMHNVTNPNWNHCHFQINFRKFHKDDEHTIGGVRKMYLKWFKDDATYVREVYCYDLFRRYGVWTAVNDIHCRLWVHVMGDAKPAYYGVYEMLETIDDEYLKVRTDKFGGHKGNLWKCEEGADLRNYGAEFNWKFGYDDDSDAEWVYELKTDNYSLDDAKAQLVDFMQKLNTKSGRELHDWLGEVIDIPLFLRTYAVNVTVGMWDDYWNHSKNFYIYFNKGGTEGYKFYLIPYDYDNTLGTTNIEGVQDDAGRHNPLEWGKSEENPLVAKIIQFEDYKALYVQYLKELVDPSKQLFDYASSRERIAAWHSKIEDYVPNDTGEDMSIQDIPAWWGNHHEYRVMEDGANNFFRVKTNSYAEWLKDF